MIDLSLRRCAWGMGDALMAKYHDEEWGRPLHDDGKIFEFLVLESMQAGLSWRTILYKRDNFRRAFAGFDPRLVAGFGEADVERLLGDASIIRNRAKILAAINNAGRFLETQPEFGTFDAYIWRFTGGAVLRSHDPSRATSPESDALAKDLKQRGYKFLGSTVCYAHMQAMGMVNDHLPGCFLA
ncbi:MAG: DNA-3-methyladenine glycosylase I [SAR202 cluster bacterium]|nr:DNA-3-methyladenine glycosylase I [SAR202 cluster bacterium]